METIRHDHIIHYIGAKEECEAQALGMGFSVDEKVQSMVANITQHVPEAVSYSHPSTDETGLLIRYDTHGNWCFQIRRAYLTKMLAMVGISDEGIA